ncbi:SGNH/GDSL hydrolase family protein [Asanoa sp. WMMD1127]|uniref:SGNH/GDSL hydrolase family protein n=1 Tax=Asanoa sp. WMMD1127 TaxID=3016107 RepID=UPI00241784D5|nr:SGNH/GDSL hydrolase family protein [Asanoa sp. WMMD1127]MDG4826341.1 SGNH/GDSL hydrolase family protein [Asanoa sp. WMMD1127]
MRRLLTMLTAAVLATVTLTGSAGATGGGQSWVATWGTAVTGAATPPQPATTFDDQTLRQVVHVSAGGTAVRVRLSNEYGTRPLAIGAARIARHATGSAIVPGTDRPLTFGGRGTVSIPPGAPAVSDPVRLPVAAGADLVISLYLPAPTPAATLHSSAFQRTYVAAGDVTRAADLPGAQETTSWYFLSGVTVAASARSGAVVAFGDSITDGAVTTVDANHRWPDFLAARLRADRKLRDLGVVNAGIGGNRLLYDGNTLPDPVFGGLGPIFGDSALSRFDRDVAARPGVRHVIVLLGINDIGQPGSIAPAEEAASAEDLIFAHRQLIARAHERGLRIHGATLTPFEGTAIPGYYTPANEAKRQALNAWIRTSGEYDGVVDFDRAVRDPAQPGRMLPAYDSGDGLHPNDAGMRAMAEAVPLRLLSR